MSYIIGKKCAGVCDSVCLEVCPVDCIHGPILNDNSGVEVKDLKKENKINKDHQLYINPDDCINCGACLPECPVDAIYESEEEAEEMGDKDSVVKNYNFFGLDY
tara:strand:+ start:344 stop:655 length:312 start_codon:yes stop_codon:yes gene_type:complete